jgi:uncharacterized protein (DUF2336 family)
MSTTDSQQSASTQKESPATAPDMPLSVDELYSLARNKTEKNCEELFTIISDLFFDRREVLNEHERSLMSEILRHLIHDVETSIRKRLADRLAKIDNAPHDLIVSLSNDSIEVAYPLLLQSDVLHDLDLIEIIHHRTIQHQLVVARRKEVSENVTEALVKTNNQDVICCLLENHGTAISREVMEYLVSESERVDRFQIPLVRRIDLPKDLAGQMCRWVSDALHQALLAKLAGEFDKFNEQIELATTATIEERQTVAATASDSDKLLNRLTELGELTPTLLIMALRQGEIIIFEEGLGRLSGLDSRFLRRVIYDPDGESFAILCRALCLSRNEFAEMLRLLRTASDKHADFKSSNTDQATNIFERTKQPDAMMVVKKWKKVYSHFSDVP